MNAYKPLHTCRIRMRDQHPFFDLNINDSYYGWGSSTTLQNFLRMRLIDQSTGAKVIRVLIRKEQPFELHVVVNPTDKLDVPKLEESGSYHIGDFDGDKQIDEAVSAVSVYLELEESSVK